MDLRRYAAPSPSILLTSIDSRLFLIGLLRPDDRFFAARATRPEATHLHLASVATKLEELLASSASGSKGHAISLCVKMTEGSTAASSSRDAETIARTATVASKSKIAETVKPTV